MSKPGYQYKLMYRLTGFFRWGLLTTLLLPFALLAFGDEQQDLQKDLAVQAPAAVTAASERPNILLLVADDLGYSDLSMFGGEIATPTLDALADSGMLLTNFHAAASCSPTRSTLLTGVDHHLAGLGNMHELMAENQQGQPGYEGYLNDRVITVTRLLQDAGYHTYMAGKWHLGTDQGLLPSDRGFERTFAMLEGSGSHYDEGGVIPFKPVHYVSDGEPIQRPAGYSTDLYTDKLIEFLEADRGDGQPFFLYAAYTAPHWPLHAPREYIERYKDRYHAGWDQLRAERFARLKDLGLINSDLELPPRWSDVPAWKTLTAEQQRIEARKMAVYAAMVTNLDDNIGRLLDYLRSSDQLDNTLIVFMSDNGADGADLESRLPAGMSTLQLWIYRAWLWLNFDNSLDNLGNATSFFSYGVPWAQVGSTPLFLYKGFVSEGGTRVPMIVSYPQRVPVATRSNALSSVMDLTPTFLELADVERPRGHYQRREVYPIQGRSLLPLIEGKTDVMYPEQDALGFEFIGNGALISGHWKIFQIQKPLWDGKWRLFNLIDDPRELIDLSDRYPERLAQMVAQYKAYAQNNGIIPPQAEYFDNW